MKFLKFLCFLGIHWKYYRVFNDITSFSRSDIALANSGYYNECACGKIKIKDKNQRSYNY